jgi:hypothetical protein
MRRTREQMKQIPEEELDDIESDFRGWNLHVGQLDPEELKTFDLLVDHGRARRDYSGPLGLLLGLAMVRRA